MDGEVIYYLLSNETDVTNIVSDRIYPNTAPQGKTKDYIVFQEINTNPTNIKQGTSPKDSARWQVDGYCQNDDDRDALAEAIRKALDYKSGMINGKNVDRIRFQNSNGNFDDDGEKFRTSQDFIEKRHRS